MNQEAAEAEEAAEEDDADGESVVDGEGERGETVRRREPSDSSFFD